MLAPAHRATPRRGLARWLFYAALAALAGCGSQPTGTTDPEAKLTLETLLEVYQFHIQQKGKPPSDEQTLRAFVESLPPDQKGQFRLPDNLDKLFVSSRDGQKYVVKYNTVPNPTAEAKALAWEQSGKNGKRFVALTMGYVEEYDQGAFDALPK